MSPLRSLRVAVIFAFVVVGCGSGDDGESLRGTAGAGGTGALGGAGTSGAAGATGGGGSGTSGSSPGGAGAGGAIAGATSVGGASAGAGASGGGGGVAGGAGGEGGSAGSASGSAGAPVGGAGGASGEGMGGAGGAGAGAGGVGAGGVGTGGAGNGGSAGQVGLPTGVTAMFPGPNATGVCVDPQLRITFDGTPTLGSTGSIRLAAVGGNTMVTVNMATMTVMETIGGQAFSLPRKAYVDGNEVVIYLPYQALSYGTTYSVTIENGAIHRPGGQAFTISDDTTWRFSTASAAPSPLTSLSVDLRGGQFCSVQGALDALPANNTAATTITVAAGTYHEVIYMRDKDNVTLRGQSRTGTVISGINNNNMNAGTRARSLVGIDSVTGFNVENLTIHNLTPQGGSQAEALRMQDCTRCSVRDADIHSLQDTLLWSGTIYAKNCLITGNVDFIWGDGAVYFDSCEIRTVGRAGYIVQSRNGSGEYGYVFVDSRITSDSGITGNVLARIDVADYPASHVAFINCEMGSAIAPAGWTITGGGSTSQLRFWEYQSHAPGGGAIDTGSRASGSTQISAQQAAMMRDKATVLGGWTPPD